MQTIGNTDLQTPPIILGGNVFGWTINKQSSFTILDAAMDYGLNFIDTADSYSHWVEGNKGGESEEIIGKWLKNKGGRDKITIATKVGSAMGKGEPNLSKKYILEEVEHSLRRLNTDYIDLYQSHHDDPNTPVEETMEAYAQLIKSGKVRYIGASNLSALRFRESNTAAESMQIPTYQSIQPEYNLYDRENFETKIAPYIKNTGVSVICYYALASGFLTGKYRKKEDLDQSKRGHNIVRFMNNRGARILKALIQVAEKYNCTPATIALAWLRARPLITAPISSVTNLEQLKDLHQAAHLELDPSDMKILNQASNWK